MAWFPNWQERREAIMRHGLPIIFEEVRLSPDGFLALYLRADEALLPRSHVSRGFDLHITLGYASDYPKGVAELVRDQINAAWTGRFHVLDIEWVGEGGAAMIHAEDPVAQDPLITWAHKTGYYGNGLHTKPRQLHVSL
jgi:hypothetical protein